MRMMIGSLLVALGSLSSPSVLAAERTVAKFSVAIEGKPVDVLVLRASFADGGVLVTLKAKSGGEKPQSFVVYQGGGDEDGAGEKDVRTVAAAPFDLPGGKKAVRVDVTYHAPDQPKREEQTDTTIVALDGKPRALLELTTRLARDRSKVCRENQELALAIEADDLVATTSTRLEAALGDDDVPIDKKCRSPLGGAKKIYKWVDGKFVDPSLAAPAGKPSEEESDD